MSYILDALQRNEAESNPDAAANLALNQDLKRRERRNTLIGGGIIIALVINAVLLFWLFDLDGPADVPIADTADADPATTPTTQTPGASREQTPTPPASATAEATRRVETAPAVATARGPTSKPAPAQILTLQQLPAVQRNRFPQLTFTSHIYADEADLRAVVVNGRRLEEGQRLGAVVLESITTAGVVVRFEGYRVELSVLEAWEL